MTPSRKVSIGLGVALIVAQLLLIGSNRSEAANGFVAGPMFYYSVTHEESTGWIYVIPFCKKMSADEFKKINKKCKASSPSGQRCLTDRTVELKEAGGTLKKKFALDYFVFVSEKDCVQDRESYTSGDVVPYNK